MKMNVGAHDSNINLRHVSKITVNSHVLYVSFLIRFVGSLVTEIALYSAINREMYNVERVEKSLLKK